MTEGYGGDKQHMLENSNKTLTSCLSMRKLKPTQRANEERSQNLKSGHPQCFPCNMLEQSPLNHRCRCWTNVFTHEEDIEYINDTDLCDECCNHVSLPVSLPVACPSYSVLLKIILQFMIYQTHGVMTCHLFITFTHHVGTDESDFISLAEHKLIIWY